MIERTLAFGPRGGLVGTLCLPQAPAAGVGLVLFNAGIVHRVGPHRFNVRLARRLARHAVASVRFDVSGLGDSARTDSGLAFAQQAVVDLRAAMDALGEAAAITQFTVFGFCSGGRHGLAVAEADPRVAGVILYDAYSVPTARSRFNYYRGRIREAGLLAPVGRRLRRLLAPAPAGPANSGDNEASEARIASKAQFAARLLALGGRGVRVHAMYSAEGGNYNYDGQFHDFFRGTRLGSEVTCEYLATMDHTATELAQQAAFMDRIEAWTLAVARARASGR